MGEAYLNTADHGAYIQGTNGLFRPEASLSRAEAVTMLARLSVDEDGNPLYTGASGTGGFSDVSLGDWYAPYVAFAQKYGIASGYPDGTFRPEQPVSRAELVKLISSYFEVTGGTAAFPDVAADYWAADVIAFAAQQGWVSGYPRRHLPPRRAGGPGGGGEDPQPRPGSPGRGAARLPPLHRRAQGSLGLRRDPGGGGVPHLPKDG